MNLAIDFGNTFTKAGIFDDDRLISIQTSSSTAELQQIIADNKPDRIIISTVNKQPEDIDKLLQGLDYLVLRYDTPLPFKNVYKTPMTLGTDRIAAVAGAQGLFPGANCLIIDTGTCLTYDIIDDKGRYFGGSISPGLGMRFQALHNLTANLPLINFVEDPPLTGKTTEEAIQSGVINGATAEIHEIIRMYSDKFADLRIIICGGDAKFFEKRLKANIFAAPELVLRGLNRILLYNA